MIPVEITRRKSRIERDFKRMASGATLNVIPQLPDSLTINIKKGNVFKSKTIHVNEISHVRDTMKQHDWV
jgi:purine-nucleoside phosphorylase